MCWLIVVLVVFVAFWAVRRSRSVRVTEHDAGPVRLERIIQGFTDEISSWPEDQARRALQIVRSTVSDEQANIEELMQELTFGQFEYVADVVRQIHGETDDL